jgi:outer membrane protein assembly factor BamB
LGNLPWDFGKLGPEELVGDLGMNMKPFAGWTLGLLALGAVGLPLAADTWPRFRGPGGDGVASGQRLPDKMDLKNNLLYKARLSGSGNGSPVLWNDRLFLQESTADGSARHLVCLQARDGKELWRATEKGTFAKTHAKSSMASATPAVDAERVACLTWDGKTVNLAAYDHAGKQQWRVELGAFASQHGFGHSPVLHQGRVFVNFDQDGSAKLTAFDAATGKTLWEADRKAFRSCYSTPLIRAAGGGEELVVGSTAGATGYDPATGKVLWDHAWKFDASPLRTVASPLLVGDKLVLCSGDGKGDRHMQVLQLAGGKAELLWEEKKTFPYVPMLLTQGGRLLGVNDKGMALCCDLATGKMVYNERLADAFSASPVLVDGKMIAVDERGRLYVVDPSVRGTKPAVLSRVELGEAVIASPAVGDGKIWVRGENHLFCLGTRKE